ncbi:MAG TPA: hypothetical protein VFV24_00950, partial [Candidatus Eisenbacteria bacterium]|nr:hypothetical protein [Candidatus Eisenbacteria bacterium]
WSRTYGFDRWNHVCEYRSRANNAEWSQFYDTEGRLLGARLHAGKTESIAYWLGEEMPERDVQVLVQEYDAYVGRFSRGS